MPRKTRARKSQKAGAFGLSFFGKTEMSPLMTIIASGKPEAEVAQEVSAHLMSGLHQETGTDGASWYVESDGVTSAWTLDGLKSVKDKLCAVRKMGGTNEPKTALDYVFAAGHSQVLRILMDAGILACPGVNVKKVLLYRLRKIGEAGMKIDDIKRFNEMAVAVTKSFVDQAELTELVGKLDKALNVFVGNQNTNQKVLAAIRVLVGYNGLYRVLFGKLESKGGFFPPGEYAGWIDRRWTDVPSGEASDGTEGSGSVSDGNDWMLLALSFLMFQAGGSKRKTRKA